MATFATSSRHPIVTAPPHVIFEPLDFISRLAALVPKPRVNLTRFHCVFAPNSKHRALVTKAARGRGSKEKVSEESQTSTERRTSMTLAQRMKRVFNIDIETCPVCGGTVRIIACIEDPVVIKKILAHLDKQDTPLATGVLPEGWAPPVGRFNGRPACGRGTLTR